MSYPEILTRRFAFEDVEIAYTEVEGSGPPLVLVHGLTGHRDDFLPQLPDLAESGRRVLVPDGRGHGDATHGGDASRFRFETLVEDLRAFLEGVGATPCDLLGHSFGGMVSLRFALAHPGLLRSLVLMDTAPFAPDGYARAGFEKGGAIAESRGMAFLQTRVERRARAMPSSHPPDVQTEKWADAYWPHQRRRYRAMDPAGYAALGIAMVEQTSLIDRLGELRLPVTAMVGDDDTNFLAGHDAFAQGIEGVHAVVIEDAGHHPHRENSSRWLRAMRGHFARVEG